MLFIVTATISTSQPSFEVHLKLADTADVLSLAYKSLFQTGGQPSCKSAVVNLNCFLDCPGVDKGRMARARTALYAVIIHTLTEQGVAYSFPQFQQTSLGYLPEHFGPPAGVNAR